MKEENFEVTNPERESSTTKQIYEASKEAACVEEFEHA